MKFEGVDGVVRELLQRALTALAGNREHVIIVGGLAKILYAHHPDFHASHLRPRATVDVDITLQPEAVRQAAAIHDRLLAAGLVDVAILDAEGDPTEQQYQLEEQGRYPKRPECLEFLVPKQGASPRKVRPTGVMPTPLPHVDLHRVNPLVVTVPPHGELFVPHPLSYIFQKQLIRSGRPPHKQISDQADIFYSIYSFTPDWHGWGGQWTHFLQFPVYRKRALQAREDLRKLYEDERASGSRDMQRVFGGDPDGITAAIASLIVVNFVEKLSIIQ